ncbi:lipopolysaccharide heptosyltransferase II [Aurantivibrio plasticivorans]
MTDNSPSETDDLINDNPKMLIIGPSWVGDMVMAQALFVLLKQQKPDREIDVIAPAWTRPLLERMPEIRGSLDMPIGHGKFMWSERKKIGRGLRGQYQECIVLPNSWKSALIPFFANIPKRIGWRGEMRFGLLNDIRLLNKRRYPLMVQRYVALGLPNAASLPDPLPLPKLVAHDVLIPKLLEHFELNLDKPVLALCPGAEFGPAKQWPESHYSAVAQTKISEGWQVWIMGSEKDRAVAEKIKGFLPQDMQTSAHVLAGATSLAEAIDLLSRADAVVANDSGLMHIAAALQKPLVAVYGSTSPEFTPPLGERVITESIPVDCGPCFKRECPKGHLKCLQELQPQQVLKSLHAVSQHVVEIEG